MSYQATMARAAAADADRAWRQHRTYCLRCGTAARRRRYADLCRAGAGIRAERSRLRADAEREAELDKLPPPGQGALFEIGDLA